MIVGTVNKDGRNSGALADRMANLVGKHKVQPDEVEGQESNALLPIMKHECTSKQIVMYASATLDCSQCGRTDWWSDYNLRRSSG